MKRSAIIELCLRFGVKNLAVFGSATTDDFDPARSDIDFLVEFDLLDGTNRFDAFFDLKDGLETLLGLPVDLVTPSALVNPYFAEKVKGSKEELYAA
ncbi:MAG: hypothetical protein HKL80_04495 [Acidimicrobiales bacterium]|nr:hypothetical protein [Acidimicrobiales bacterium]